MRTLNITEDSIIDFLIFRAKAYIELVKFRLSALVTFSAAFGFILGDSGYLFSWGQFLALIFGGFMITGASGAANEIWERDYDKLMKRTQNRPLPLKQISLSEAYWFASLMAISGISILWIFTNPLTTF
jgi:heme o synthase